MLNTVVVCQHYAVCILKSCWQRIIDYQVAEDVIRYQGADVFDFDPVPVCLADRSGSTECPCRSIPYCLIDSYVGCGCTCGVPVGSRLHRVAFALCFHRRIVAADATIDQGCIELNDDGLAWCKHHWST